MIDTEKIRDLAHSSRGEWSESECKMLFDAADQLDSFRAALTVIGSGIGGDLLGTNSLSADDMRGIAARTLATQS